MYSPEEFRRQTGYDMVGCLLRDGRSIPDAECRAILGTIEKEIHSSPNRARSAMNGALIAIGVYNPALKKEALAAAKRVGQVEVDHGGTSCKTPDAAAYIQKAAARNKK